MQNTLFIQLLVGLLIGGGLGAAMGYFGKCTTGACPLTANPLRGGMIGAMLGGLLAFSVGSSRGSEETAGGDLHINSAEDFDARVLRANQPVLVDFYADWCGPCRMLAPVIEKLAEQYAGRAIVVKVNVDRLPEVAGRYGIQGIPAVLFFHKGEEAERLVGVRPQGAYSEILDKLIGPSS
ncbi:MAG TPA: thioredoxin [Sedimentisphaerales bacterium]|jgi:thioredoxin 1|nr:thioredoxin [Sedimentisphaerales bacterium]HNU27829.1 thioredoxin [Sedimentisphaerales bacterium]